MTTDSYMRPLYDLSKVAFKNKLHFSNSVRINCCTVRLLYELYSTSKSTQSCKNMMIMQGMFSRLEAMVKFV